MQKNLLEMSNISLRLKFDKLQMHGIRKAAVCRHKISLNILLQSCIMRIVCSHAQRK